MDGPVVKPAQVPGRFLGGGARSSIYTDGCSCGLSSPGAWIAATSGPVVGTWSSVKTPAWSKAMTISA